jgi:hypothetical protein
LPVQTDQWGALADAVGGFEVAQSGGGHRCSYAD